MKWNPTVLNVHVLIKPRNSRLGPWVCMFSPCMRGFSPGSLRVLRFPPTVQKHVPRGRKTSEKLPGSGMLFSLGWQVAYERENSDKKTNAEDGCSGPLVRNVSTAQLRHGDERDAHKQQRGFKVEGKRKLISASPFIRGRHSEPISHVLRRMPFLTPQHLSELGTGAGDTGSCSPVS